jgi:alpha-tubulin suppressor-like RCC1 family protein
LTNKLTEQHKLLSWGHNFYGQLGVGDNENRNKPVVVDFFDNHKVISVACGHFHTLALCGQFGFFSTFSFVVI